MLLSNPRIQNLTVRVGEAGGARTFAAYNPRTHVIEIRPFMLSERPEAIATSLAHELWHAISPTPWPRDFSACVADEVWAFIMQSAVWAEIRPDYPWTNIERQFQTTAEVWGRDISGVHDFDADNTDFLNMWAHVLYDFHYLETCAD